MLRIRLILKICTPGLSVYWKNQRNSSVCSIHEGKNVQNSVPCLLTHVCFCFVLSPWFIYFFISKVALLKNLVWFQVYFWKFCYMEPSDYLLFVFWLPNSIGCIPSVISLFRTAISISWSYGPRQELVGATSAETTGIWFYDLTSPKIWN